MTDDMKQEPDPGVGSSDLLGWLRGKIADAEKTVIAREQMESAWRDGTAKSWKAVGCKMNKTARLEEASRQGRIAVKCRREVQMFKAVFDALNHPNSD